MNSIKKKKNINSEGREIIYNVYKFMQEEKYRNELKIPLNRLGDRVAESTGVDVRTVKRIVQEASNFREGETFSSPKENTKQEKKTVVAVQFKAETVRNLLYSYTVMHKQKPTMAQLFDEVIKADSVNFSGKQSSFVRFVHKIGFRWRKTEDNGQVLVEKHEIRLKRIQYLRQVKQYRNEGRDIIYFDETYLHSSHTAPLDCNNGSYNCLETPVGKGQRLIIRHAGSSKGFVPNALNIEKSGRKSGGETLNHANFVKWLIEKFIPNVEQNSSVLVLDSISYNNIMADDLPTISWSNLSLQFWLLKRGISYENLETRGELLEKIQLHKPPHKTDEIHRILTEHGIKVLCLPAYHLELNPIKKIWPLMRNYVAANNVTFKLNDVRALAEGKLSEISSSDWQNICLNVEKLEEEYLQREELIDDIEDMTSMNLECSSSSSSEVDEHCDEDEDLVWSVNHLICKVY